jgi:hypothetical protein
MENKKLSETIQTLVAIRGESNLEVSDECLFDNAIKVYISNSIQESKLPTKSSHGGELGQKGVGRFSPSIKQYKILVEAGLKKEIINSMSKQEVSKVIGEYLNNLKKENI